MHSAPVGLPKPRSVLPDSAAVVDIGASLTDAAIRSISSRQEGFPQYAREAARRAENPKESFGVPSRSGRRLVADTAHIDLGGSSP